MGSSSMHGQFTVGGGLSSTIFSDPMNLEAVLSFSPSPAVNLQAVVTPFAIPLVTFSSSWQGTCPKVDSVISLGSPSVSKNSVGESMLHRVSVDHSLILHTDQSSEGVPSSIIPPVQVTYDSSISIETSSSRRGLIDHKGLHEQQAVPSSTPVMHSLQVTLAIPVVTSDFSDLNTSLISSDSPVASMIMSSQ
ncbi:hypothetical protein Q3G72_017457 [Acer saccharum]|nr:hypothetical protein Q3G72_017457 [Acer saccharum]